MYWHERSANGELGLLPSDAGSFLAACERDRVEILGWELWLVDQVCDRDGGEPRQSPGRWCGMIPMREDPVSGVFTGSGDISLTKIEIASLKLEELVEPRWLPYLRFNFTLGI
jgi:hypothetical protein